MGGGGDTDVECRESLSAYQSPVLSSHLHGMYLSRPVN